MSKKLILFGASGNLGKGAAELFIKKDYDQFYFLGSGVPESVSDSRVRYIKTSDLSSEEEVSRVFRHIETDREDILFMFSTLGAFHAGESLSEISIKDWNLMFDSNLKSNYLVAKYFINLAERCSGGGVCFTSALSGFTPTALRVAYGASKSALNYLIQSLAEECLQKKISVTGIAPYIIDTQENRSWVNKDDLDTLQKPVEIAELVHFIFHNYHFLSGTIIPLKFRFKPNT